MRNVEQTRACKAVLYGSLFARGAAVSMLNFILTTLSLILQEFKSKQELFLFI